MKFEKCPKCKSTYLGDNWVRDGKLQQYCIDCKWHGEHRIPETIPNRIPETIPISAVKKYTGVSGGWRYQCYDRYGHTIVMSRSYSTQGEAQNGADRTLTQGLMNKTRGPYRAFIYPPSVMVEGIEFKCSMAVI
jgi:hypothetical protein